MLSGDFKYHEDSRSQWCFLDYESQAAKMNDRSKPHWSAALVLPIGIGPVAIKDILQGWASKPESFVSPKSAKTRSLHLEVPRFRITKGIPMQQHLKGMGFHRIFDPNADFTGMSELPLFVNEVAHQVVVEVNEEGTEVGASTIAKMMFGSASPPILKFDRPFIFVVFDSNSEIILCSAIPGIGKDCTFT